MCNVGVNFDTYCCLICQDFVVFYSPPKISVTSISVNFQQSELPVADLRWRRTFSVGYFAEFRGFDGLHGIRLIQTR